MKVRPYLVNGEWRTGEGTFEVHSPYDDDVVAELGVPADQPPLLNRRLARFVEHLRGYLELADVVQ